MIFEKDIKLSEKITLLHLNHMTSIINLVPIDVEIPRIDSRRSLDKKFTKLMCINL